MTLAARIIPCLDVKDGRVVKGVNFVNLRDAGDPVEQAEIYDAQQADEICFLDINASHENRGTMIDVVKRTADRCFMPLTVGGGVRSVEDARALLLAGADKVGINTAAVLNPDIINEVSGKFGGQALVVLSDVKRVGNGRWEVFTHGGRNATGKDAIAYAVNAVERGAGELLITSMDRDGTGDGYDIELLQEVTSRVRVPVIASGGAGKLQDLVDAIVKGGASASLAATIFHYGTHTIAEARAALAAAGVPQRKPEAMRPTSRIEA